MYIFRGLAIQYSEDTENVKKGDKYYEKAH